MGVLFRPLVEPIDELHKHVSRRGAVESSNLDLRRVLASYVAKVLDVGCLTGVIVDVCLMLMEEKAKRQESPK